MLLKASGEDAYNAYDKFSDIHDKYEKNREQLDEYAKKMDSQMEAWTEGTRVRKAGLF